MEKKHAYFNEQEVIRESTHIYSVLFTREDNYGNVLQREYVDMYYNYNKNEFVDVVKYMDLKHIKFRTKIMSYVSKEKAFTYIRNRKRRMKEICDDNEKVVVNFEETKG